MHVTPHWPTRPQRKPWMPHCLGRGILPARNLASLAGADSLFAGAARDKLEQLHAELLPLSERYDVVVANPPYMGSNNMNKWLAGWTKNTYPDSKRDLCTCFIERGQNLAVGHGYEALITSDTCMYISSFEQLRKNILSRSTIVGFIDTRGTNAHPDVFDANAGWVLHNAFVEGVKGTYFKLNQAIAAKEAGYLEALANPECGWLYRANASGFDAIPGSPIAYWASSAMLKAFNNGKTLDSVSTLKQGMKTANNETFLRLWQEVSFSRTGCRNAGSIDKYDGSIWVPYLKGGDFRKWYGNYDYVVYWKDNGETLKAFKRAVLRNIQFSFRASISWSVISSGRLALRTTPKGFMFDGTGSSIFEGSVPLEYIQGFLNSSVGEACASVMSPTLTFEVGQLARYPLLVEEENVVVEAVSSCVHLSKIDYDSFETSWAFERHPLL